jgi:hypothetical protein
MDTFKFKITLHRHNAIHNLNYYDLPDPPRFSLPSTIKNLKKKIAGLPVFYSGSNESSLDPQFKWLDNTFNSSNRTSNDRLILFLMLIEE